MIEYQQYWFFLSWIYGAAFMIYFHNFFISILLYKARQANGSNILKIVFNLTGTITFILKFVILAAPSTVSVLGCEFIMYLANIDNCIYRESVAIFLLWRLKQIGPTEYDKWIGLTLIIARTVGHFTYLGFLNPTAITIPSEFTFLNSYNECTFNLIRTFNPQIAFVCADLAVDIYVTARLIMILRRANKNARQISTNINSKTKRTLFTAVMYWNFVRLLVAIGQNIVYIVLLAMAHNTIVASSVDSVTCQNFFQVFFFVLMSYVVTVDAEIVRVIEGKKDNQKESGSSGSKKSFPGTPGSRIPPTYKTHSSSTQSYGESYDEDKFNVSMKRLSFFEWATMVVGFRHEDGSRQEFDKDELEEIIDGPSEAAGSYPEKRNSDLKRSSDISGASTVISTSSHEHDIV